MALSGGDTGDKARFKGSTALVTGAARGIGLAIAQYLCVEGANVALVDIDAEALTAAAKHLTEYGDQARILSLEADITQDRAVRKAVADTVSQYGALTILVNNAGICPLTAFADIDADEWDRVLAVNLKGAFLLSQAALPHIQGSGTRGRIINVASVAGQMGGVLIGAHYAASKAGLIGLNKTLARLLAPSGATANCIAPGVVDTDLTAGWTDVAARVQAQAALDRFGEAREIAAAVGFLASAEASYITGTTLDVNGGLYLR